MEDRKLLWVNLSRLYLDTELQAYHFRHLAKSIIESPFSYQEVRIIDKEEVFPLLYRNLLSATGIWDGFDSEWLIYSIEGIKEKNNYLSKKFHRFMYFCMKRMFQNDWRKIELAMIDEPDERTNADPS